MEARTKLRREDWQPDDAASQCHRCSCPFTWIVRRHHCRHCGLLVCATCSSKVLKLHEPRRAARSSSAHTSIPSIPSPCGTCSPVSQGGFCGESDGETRTSASSLATSPQTDEDGDVGEPSRVCDACYTKLTAPLPRPILCKRIPPSESVPNSPCALRLSPATPQRQPRLQVILPRSTSVAPPLLSSSPCLTLNAAALARQAQRRRSVCVVLLDEREERHGSSDMRFSSFTRRLDSLCSSGSSGGSSRRHGSTAVPVRQQLLRAMLESVAESGPLPCGGQTPSFLYRASAASGIRCLRREKSRMSEEMAVQRFEADVPLSAGAVRITTRVSLLGVAERVSRPQRHPTGNPSSERDGGSSPLSERLCRRLAKVSCTPLSYVLVVIRSEEESRSGGAPRGGLPFGEAQFHRWYLGMAKKCGAPPLVSVIDVSGTDDSGGAGQAEYGGLGSPAEGLQRAVGERGLLYSRRRRFASSCENLVGLGKAGQEMCGPLPVTSVQDDFPTELSRHVQHLLQRMIWHDEELYQNEIRR